jgi:hypothetical protein
MNSIGWLGGATAPPAFAAASAHFGMGVCMSATSLIYICFGSLLLVGRTIALRWSVAPSPDLAKEPVP